ncbi:hypothetical protein DFH09DRAFT_563006 [Mycena vulgaris]|nr:hypothetical protein DFH09DRAFT_563006 [Mycena vulgaris]
MPSSVHDSFLPLDGLSRLSQSERIDFYNIVNDGIGPALGIEESAGTYKAHMERLHFNRWRPVVPRHHSIDLPISRPQAVSVVPRPPTITEKENIDPQASASRTNSRPSNNHHYLQSAGPSSSPHIRNSHHLSVTSRREHPPTPFPPAPTNPLMPPTSSATPPSAPLPRGRPTPLIWTSPIKNSQSTSFRTQQWQTQLSQAFAARVSPFAIPYSYPAAGDRPRIVHKPKTIAPRVGMCSGEPK